MASQHGARRSGGGSAGVSARGLCLSDGGLRVGLGVVARLVVREGHATLLGALPREVLAIAGAVDVEADGTHGEAIQDGDGQGGIAQVAPPGAQLDVGGKGGGGAPVPAVDEVEEGVCRRWLIVALLDLAESDVINEQKFDRSPALEALRVGAVGEAGVEIVEEIDGASVADGHLLLAGAQRERLEEVALAGTALAGDDEILLAADEVEA